VVAVQLEVRRQSRAVRVPHAKCAVLQSARAAPVQEVDRAVVLPEPRAQAAAEPTRDDERSVAARPFVHDEALLETFLAVLVPFVDAGVRVRDALAFETRFFLLFLDGLELIGSSPSRRLP